VLVNTTGVADESCCFEGQQDFDLPADVNTAGTAFSVEDEQAFSPHEPPKKAMIGQEAFSGFPAVSGVLEKTNEPAKSPTPINPSKASDLDIVLSFVPPLFLPLV